LVLNGERTPNASYYRTRVQSTYLRYPSQVQHTTTPHSLRYERDLDPVGPAFALSCASSTGNIAPQSFQNLVFLLRVSTPSTNFLHPLRNGARATGSRRQVPHHEGHHRRQAHTLRGLLQPTCVSCSANRTDDDPTVFRRGLLCLNPKLRHVNHCS